MGFNSMQTLNIAALTYRDIWYDSFKDSNWKITAFVDFVKNLYMQPGHAS